MKYDKELECTGYYCPMPIVKTRIEIDSMEKGQVLKVTADDPGARADFPAWCEETGNKLLELNEEGGELTFYIRKEEL